MPDALLVKEALKQENLPVEVYVAEDGQKTLDFFARAEQDREAPHPDVVLLDLNLPKRDGLEILEQIRRSERWKSIPVLVVTSSDSPEELRRAAEMGAGYFHKPADYRSFLKVGGVLRQFLAERGVL